MVTKDPGGVALYLQIAEELKQDLAKLKYGEQIPAETELMERYNVSRGTVRQAVSGLVRNGYLYKAQGKGTFRGSGLPKHEGYNRMPSFSRSVLLSGHTPTIADIKLETVAADEAVSGFLSIPVGEEVWKLSRFRGVYGRKVSCLAEAYIPKDVLPDLKAEDLEMSLISMILGKFGIKISSTTNSLTAAIAGDDYARKFHVDSRSAVLISDYVMRDISGRPIVYDRSVNWGKEAHYTFESIFTYDSEDV